MSGVLSVSTTLIALGGTLIAAVMALSGSDTSRPSEKHGLSRVLADHSGLANRILLACAAALLSLDLFEPNALKSHFSSVLALFGYE